MGTRRCDELRLGTKEGEQNSEEVGKAMSSALDACSGSAWRA